MDRIGRRELMQGAGAIAEVIFIPSAFAGTGDKYRAIMRRSSVGAQTTDASEVPLSYAREQESQ